MKEIKKLGIVNGGTVEQVVTTDNRLTPNNGTILYKVIDDKTGYTVAYFVGQEQAINYDRLINYGFNTPQFIRGNDGLYQESDCYEISSINA